jgi:phosphopantetheine--protein transferase-like protein
MRLEFENIENLNSIGIGVDIEKIERFKEKTLESDSHFLNKIFTKNELNYSFKNKNSAQHLTARYCAKEATVKALHSLNIANIYYKDIEVINLENGAPTIKIEKQPNIKIKVSMSHTTDTAIAFVIAQNTQGEDNVI